MDKELKILIVTSSGDRNDPSHDTLKNVLENGIGLNYDSIPIISIHLDINIIDRHSALTEANFFRVMESVDLYSPKVIVTLGEDAFTLMTGVQQNITAVRGKKFAVKSKVTDIPVFPTFSSGYIIRVPAKLDTFAMDIYKAHQFSLGIVSQIMTPYKLVTDFEELKTLVSYIKQTGLCGFDFETKSIVDGLVTFEEGFFATMLSLSFQAGGSYVIPLEHFESPFSKKEVDAIMQYLGHHIFSNRDVRKVAHNLDFDAHVLGHYGIQLKGRVDDTMLMAHLVNEVEKKGLKDTTTRYYPSYAGYEDEVKNLVKQHGGWEFVPMKSLAPYAATDSDVALKLLTQLEMELQSDPRSYVIYRNLTMYAFRALFDAERRGMLINYQDLLKGIEYTDGLIKAKEQELRNHKVVKRYELLKARAETDKAIDALKDKIDALVEKRQAKNARELELEQGVSILEKQYAMESTPKNLGKLEKKRQTLANHVAKKANPTVSEQNYRNRKKALVSGELSVYEGINFNSTPQLEDLFYISEHGFNFKGVKGTGKDVLEAMNDDTGFVDLLLVYRSLVKTQSTYLVGLRDRLDKNFRIHTSFLLGGTRSGRLSSQNPNLQNLPRGAKLSDEGLIEAVKWIKAVFACPEGYEIVQADYSQAELRAIAAFAAEMNMIEVYKGDGDIHSKTAASLLGIDLKDFDKKNPKHSEARSDAKAVNFGFIYGMGAEGFVDYAWSNYRKRYTLREAEKFRNDFFTAYPKLLDYHDIYVQKGERYGWVRTLFGRRRRLPDILSDDFYRKGMDERVAINSPIQGTSGEFTIFAIGLLRDRLDPRILLGNTVHDSIIFYVPKDILHEGIAAIKHTCENLPTEQYFGKKLPYGVRMKVDIETSDKNWKSISEYQPPEKV